MIETTSRKTAFIEIDLRSKDGNAFNLLTCAKKLAYQMGFSEEEEKEILDEMRAADYENLVQVFNKYFGEFVILYR
jgi:hypothetical protein